MYKLPFLWYNRSIIREEEKIIMKKFTQVLTMFQLKAFQHEYGALLDVVQPGPDILDRISYLEQIFDYIDMGEILINMRSK